MAIPTKKMYDRNGKVIFDPSNPEDVRRQEELNKQIEMAKQLFSIVDPRGGGGIGAIARGISKAALAKMAKSKFTQNRVKQLADLVTKPMTRGKKAVPKTTPTVKEVVETKPTIPTTIPTSGSTVSDKIKSLSNAEIKAFENVKNVRELAEKQVKNAPTTISNAPKKSVSDIIRENIANRKLGTKGFTREEITAYNQKTAKGLQTAKDIVSKNLERVKELKKESETFYQKSVPESIAASNKKITDRAIGAGVIAGVIGAGAGTTYYGMQLSNKDNKKTTTPQKTGPVDLKRIINTKPSNIEGVRTVKGTDGKDYGIVWNNTTKSWDYYRGNKTTENKQQEKSGLAIGGGDSKRNDSSGTGSGGNQRTTTGGGTGTTPRSATGQAFDKAFAEARKQAGGAGGIFEWNGKKYGTALEGETVPKDRVEVGKITAPLMGDETYKADPSLEKFRQQDDDKQLLARAEAQKKEMKEFKPTESLDVLPMPTKPLSSLMFKTSSLNPQTGSRVEPISYNTIDTVDTKSKKLRKKSYGGNLAMLKYMK